MATLTQEMKDMVATLVSWFTKKPHRKYGF